MIVYEYPFNERIRTLLRLEDLFEKFRYFLGQHHPQQHHVALSTIFEILEVAGRSDMKSEMLQELERQKQTILGFKSHPNVEIDQLDQIVAEIDRITTSLIAVQGKTGQSIRDNEWLMSIRGRTIIPGGACEFDIPSYYAWQHRPAELRYSDITNWFAPIAPLADAICMVLRLLRGSGIVTQILAPAGNYQQMLQGKTYQMLRLTLDESLGVIPEISANKYMLWIRFTSQDGDMKPKSYDGDVPFLLTLCNF